MILNRFRSFWLKTGYFPLLSVLFASGVFADCLEFRDSVRVTTTILDTAGCSITIRHRGNIVVLEKRKVSRIIINSDTISYASFVCTPEKAAQKATSNIEEGYNPDRVQSLIRKMPQHDTIVKPGVLYYYAKPVSGTEFESCWDSAFADFEATIKKQYPAACSIDSERLVKLLSGKVADTNCLLIPLEARYGYFDGNKLYGDFDMEDLRAGSGVAMVPRIGTGMGGLGIGGGVGGGSGPSAKTTVRIVTVDLKKREVISTIVSTEFKSKDVTYLFGSSQKNHSRIKMHSLRDALEDASYHWQKRFGSPE